MRFYEESNLTKRREKATGGHGTAVRTPPHTHTTKRGEVWLADRLVGTTDGAPYKRQCTKAAPTENV